MNEIVGPDSVENGSTDELILDCDFEAKGEDDVVLKWFYNGMEDQIYQWIALNKNAYAMGSLRNLIDPTYKISDDPNSMMRALRFKDVNSTLSGNYTCKVDTDDEVKWLTKQVIVYCKWIFCCLKLLKLISNLLNVIFMQLKLQYHQPK